MSISDESSRDLMAKVLMLGASLCVTNPAGARLVGEIAAGVERLVERVATLEMLAADARRREIARRRRRGRSE